MQLLVNLSANAFSLLCLTAIALAGFGVGRALLRVLRLDPPHDLLAITAWSMGLGLVVCGLTLSGLGLAAALYAPLIGGLTLVATCWGAGEAAQTVFAWREARQLTGQGTSTEAATLTAPITAPPAWVVLLSTGVLFVILTSSLLAALAPPTAGDALCYHLEIPKVFLRCHGLAFDPFNDNVTYPLLVEMLYLWGLSLDGGVAAQLVHWLLGTVLILGTVHLAQGLVGASWAWIVGTVLACVPAIGTQMSVPLNDVGLAALTTLSLAGVCRYWYHDDSPQWLLAAGLTMGGALSTKYSALLFLAALAGAMALGGPRRDARRRSALTAVSILAIVAVSTAALWYVRAWWHRGDPVYPFLSAALGSQDAPPASDLKRPLALAPWDLLQAPWQLTMTPERFGGRGHRAGAAWLAALPLLLCCRRLRGLNALLLLAALYFTGWLLLRQNLRFLIPIAPVLSVAVVWVAMELQRFPRGAGLVAAACLTLAVAAEGVGRIGDLRGKLPVVVGRESREQYLLRSEPSFAAAQVANQLVRLSGAILSQDYRAFYFRTPVVRECVYRRLTQYDRRLTSAASAAELSRQLRAAGFGCLLLAESPDAAGIGFDPTLSRLVDDQMARDPRAPQHLMTLADYRFRDADGADRRCRLVLLR